MQLQISGLGMTAPVSSTAYSEAVLLKWVVVPDAQKSFHAGYNPAQNAYYAGYRPPGKCNYLRGVSGLRGVGDPNCGEGWMTIPTFAIISQSPPVVLKPVIAPTAVKPSAATCPVCPVCPTVKSCPVCPACGTQTPAASADTGLAAHSKYGMNIGLLLAAGLTAGGGYYAWKKGWFKKLAKKRR
jgi:hypothetical protein